MTCPICQREITRTRGGVGTKLLKTCGRRPCVRALLSRQRQGVFPAHAQAGFRKMIAGRVRETVFDQFGELSPREVALYRHVWKLAWNRGYQKAYKSAQQGYRRYTRRAAA